MRLNYALAICVNNSILLLRINKLIMREFGKVNHRIESVYHSIQNATYASYDIEFMQKAYYI